MKTVRFKLEDRDVDVLRDFCKTNRVSVSDYVAGAVIERLNLDRYGDMNVMKKLSESEKVKYSVDVKVNTEAVEMKKHEEKREEILVEPPKKTDETVRTENPVRHNRRQLNAK